MTDSITVPILDKIIGGILPGHAYFFHGSQGTGKTVLGIQVALSWARAGRTTLYLTNETPVDLLEHSEILGLSLRDHCETGQVIIGHYSDSAGDQMASLGSSALLQRLEKLKEKHPITSVIFDSAETFLSGINDSDRQRSVISQLIDGLRELGWNSILLVDNKLISEQPTISAALRDRCWATIGMGSDPDPLSFWKRWKGVKREETHSLRVEKSRQSTPVGHRIPYCISANVGIIPAWEATGPVSEVDMVGKGGAKPRVLLASEEKDFFNPLASLLNRSSEVKIVSTGVDALAQTVTWNPQVVVAEVDMPDLSGFAVARALRQGRYVMPVILISRKRRRQSERIRAYLNGATDFFFYPHDAVEMAYRIAIASRMQLSVFSDNTEEHMLDVLIKRAESHVFDRSSFLQALSLSLMNSTHLSSPVSLIGFRMQIEDKYDFQEEMWTSFKTVLDQNTRSGDLITWLDDRSVVVLLSHELRQGASAYLVRMKQFMESENVGRFTGSTDWMIESATQTIQLTSEGEVNPQEILASVFANPKLFISSSTYQDEAEDDETRRKGA